MTSVNTRPAPYTVGYEQPQNPTPIRYENSAEAAANSEPQIPSAPPRTPMNPEQRGAFSSHNKIANQQPQGADSAGQLAELTQKNQGLRARFKGFSAQVGPQIRNLQKQVADLTKQVNTSDKATPSTSTEPQVAPSDTPPSTQSTSVTEPGQARSLQELTRETKEFREELVKFFGELKTVIQELTQQIQGLSQRIDAIGTLQPPTPSAPETTAETAAAETTAAQTATEAAPALAPDAPAMNQEPQVSVSSGADELVRENAQLAAGLEQMEVQFKAVVAQLQLEIETLSNKISQQK